MLKFGTAITSRNFFVNFVKQPIVVANKKNGLDSLAQSVRFTSFYNRLTGEQLWKGVTSVSNAGKKKGRGKGADKRNVRNLNLGQRIGVGKIRVNWPGLNTPVIRHKELQFIKQEKEENEVEKTTTAPPLRKKLSMKIHPLDRGWSGKQQRGRRTGPPEPLQDERFDDFQSIVLDSRLRSSMTSILGRKRIFFSIVATGNKNGLIGIGRAKGIEAKSSIALAKTRASKRLITIDLINNHAVNHDFFSEYGRTKLFVFKKPEGFGLRCHRVIIALCQLIGIKDLHVKVEGAINVTHIIRAFIIGLLRQKTYQQIADESKLHLVEFRSDTKGFPQVLASPEKCLTLSELQKNPISYEEFIMDGRLVFRSPEKRPFYERLPSWQVYLRRTLYQRNHNLVKQNLIAEYGALESHLTKVYPECTNRHHKKTESS